MPRKQVEDLNQVKIGGAARQVNTFVAAPRVSRSNSASSLAKALTGVTNLIIDQQELDVKQATDRKLYGGSVYSDLSPEALADYETTKQNLRSMEDAEKYFLERTEQELEDPHAQSGYEEKRIKELHKFRGKHAEYLAGVAVKERSEYVLKDYLSTVSTDGVGAAEQRKLDIAKNYGMTPKDLNQMTVNSVGILIAQGKLDEADNVLNYKRGAAGTLLSNPDTAEEAQVLKKKLKTARKDIEDARVEQFKADREASELQQAKNEADFTDALDDDSLTYEEKILELNKKDVLDDVSTEYAKEARRYLKSLSEQDKETNGQVMSDFVARIYDVNELADSNPKDYLRGVNELQRDIMKMRANKELDKKEEQSLKKQIKTLTSPRVAEATKRISRSFKDAKKLIDTNLPPSYRGEAIRELFYATDAEVLSLEAEGKGKDEINRLYKTRVMDVIDNVNKQRRQKALDLTKDKESKETDEQFVTKLGYSMDFINNDAKEMGITQKSYIKVLRDHYSKTQPSSKESEQILKDEGVVKNDNGDHVSYKDSRGFLTGGHGHLMTDKEQAQYPEGTPIPASVVEQWKEQDLKEADEDVTAIFGDVEHPEVRKVLKNMAFNLGRTKLNKFTRLKQAIENNDYELAARAMRESLWYKQTGDRSKRLVDRIEKLT